MNKKITFLIIIILFILWTSLAFLIHNTNIKVQEQKENQCNDSVLVYANYNENTGIATYKNTEISICNIKNDDNKREIR